MSVVSQENWIALDLEYIGVNLDSISQENWIALDLEYIGVNLDSKRSG
jgi:hypothetical protein